MPFVINQFIYDEPLAVNHKPAALQQGVGGVRSLYYDGVLLCKEGNFIFIGGLRYRGFALSGVRLLAVRLSKN